MPQICFEYTDNVEIFSLEEIIINIHQLLAQNLPTPILNCKTRIIKHQAYLVGDGKGDNSFFYLSIAVLKGRKAEQLKIIAQELSAYLTNELRKKNHQVQISVAVSELPEIYIKS